MRVSAKSFPFILGLLWGNGREGNGEPGNKSVKVNRLGGAGVHMWGEHCCKTVYPADACGRSHICT